MKTYASRSKQVKETWNVLHSSDQNCVMLWLWVWISGAVGQVSAWVVQTGEGRLVFQGGFLLGSNSRRHCIILLWYLSIKTMVDSNFCRFSKVTKLSIDWLPDNWGKIGKT